jgi:uncharacterized membrane protein YidH (DUF202 family)
MFDSDPVDHGLPGERTDLAWNRSGLAFVACIAVLLRRIWPLRGTDQVVALVCISLGSFAWAIALSLGHTLRNRSIEARGRLTPRTATVITAGTLALAVAALALSLVGPS